MIKISIIVAVYNVEKYLDRCIKSILNQSFKEFELILVDDGSTDNSGIICNKYGKQDSRVKVIHKINGGVSSARNEGLKIAIGEYIGFVDSDDFINKYMYETLYENLIKNNADISMCNFDRVSYFSEEKQNYLDGNNEVIIYTKEEVLSKLYDNEKIKFIVQWNKIYNKKLFLNLFYDIGKYHEDEFIIHKIIYNANKIVYSSNKYYYYFENNNSIMRKEFNINRVDIIEALDKRMKFFRDKHLVDLEYKTQDLYLNYFIKYFYIVKFEFNNNIKIKQLKKIFIKNYRYLCMNPKYNISGKVLWVILIINPNLFYYLLKIKNKNEFKRIIKV